MILTTTMTLDGPLLGMPERVARTGGSGISPQAIPLKWLPWSLKVEGAPLSAQI